jgi:hypothetical protein
MTKENIFKNFVEDPLLIERGYITKQKLDKLKFIDQSGVKIIEVIKIAINGNIDNDSESVIKNKIQRVLNS